MRLPRGPVRPNAGRRTPGSPSAKAAAPRYTTAMPPAPPLTPLAPLAPLHPLLAAGLVFLGGGLGSVARYALAEALRPGRPATGDFPWATLLVNLAGAATIGLLAPRLADREPARLLLAVGVLGGFTTFSTFALEAARLAQAGHWGRAAAYVAVTNAVGLFAAALLLAAPGPTPNPAASQAANSPPSPPARPAAPPTPGREP